ncbi:hypothetical protein FQN60_012576, partial [Etheostoma spectabile]
MGGDFNCVLDTSLDKQTSRSTTNSNSSDKIKNAMQDLALVDIWRLLNPNTRADSFFSPVHNSYSRIDFMLLDSKLVSSVVTTQYHNILIRDHAPVSLDIRFNSHRDKSFLDCMSVRLTDIIATNDMEDVDDSVLDEYNTILSAQVCKQLNLIKQKQFEIVDKPQKLLAWQLRKAQASRAILRIKSDTGIILTEPKEINERFKEFYSKLYKSNCNHDADVIRSFLSGLDLPHLSSEAQAVLDGDISIAEIIEAIAEFPNNKTPGPEGFTIEFYKCFSKDLSPLLLRMFKHAASVGQLPQTLYKTNISLILKKARNELDASSYRPVSLLPNETKLISKILCILIKQ